MPSLTLQEALTLAIQHHRSGRLSEAEAIYRQILAQQPGNSEALHLMGLLSHQRGQHEQAVDLISRAIVVDPHHPAYYANLGLALKTLGRLDQAIPTLQRAIELDPSLAEAHNSLGNIWREQGFLQRAVAAYNRAIELKPNLAEAHNSLGNALKQLGQLESAIAEFHRAIKLKPDMAEAFCGLGSVLKRQGQTDAAIAALQRAIQIRFNFPEAHCELAQLLQDRDNLDAAIAGYRRAIQLKPNFAEAWTQLGNALKDQSELDESLSCFRRAIALRPDHAMAYHNLIYTMHFHAGSDQSAIQREQKIWNQQFVAPLAGSIRPHTNDRDPNRKLRIGYVSPDFRTHCQSCFTLPLLSHHDSQQVEITCYSSSPQSDEITVQLQSHAQRWRNIFGIPDEEAANMIRKDEIDILVDLTLHMANNRLMIFAHKPAPVQVSWLGYPASTGMQAMDYRITDPHLDPPGLNDAFYTEQSIRLPDSFWCYDAIMENLAVNDLPAIQNSFVTFGCLNNFCKINDEVLKLWTQVLAAVPCSRMIIASPFGQHRQRTLDQLQRLDIDPTRIEFVGKLARKKYFELYHRLDMALDTFPYTGHTTSMDSFWMGVPVISLCGTIAVSRGGLSLAKNLGLSELVTDDRNEYVRIAVDLAKDMPRLNELRRTLRSRMEASPLMDAGRFARSMEQAYRMMWKQWVQGDTL